MIFYCCEEHVDMALDEMVYGCETYPILTSVCRRGKSLSTPCEYCQNRGYICSGELIFLYNMWIVIVDMWISIVDNLFVNCL